MAVKNKVLSTNLLTSVRLHEGFRSRMYEDTVGVPTIGYGTNLLELEISKEEAEVWLRKELIRVADALADDPRFTMIPSKVRREVLIEMGYNLGVRGLFKFRRMWSALEAYDWDKAADEMLDSKWAKQVGIRARTLAQRMQTGEY